MNSPDSTAKIIPGTTKKTIVLAGNPNVGKSTLFNHLTGARQKIANYPGVTVEKKIGTHITKNGENVDVIDLPGLYSLNAKSEDETIATQCILGQLKNTPKPDAVFVVIEALNLDRGLHLFKQIQIVHPQAVLILNMMDELKKVRATINTKKLAAYLNAPVIEASARSGFGLKEISEQIQNTKPLPDEEKKKHLSLIQTGLPEQNFAEIDAILTHVFHKPSSQSDRLTEKLDNFLLHPVLGPLFFLAVMYIVFQSLFTWAAPLMDLIDSGIGALSELISQQITIGWLQSLLTDGIIAGVGSVVIFVPQIAIAFLLIGFLEMSGYLARGAFLIDRLMRWVGLEGRSFIPLISSFACAIPGIMATRTIPNSRQRLITILIAPFMTCSARLPVYTLLIATFIPTTKFLGIFQAQGLTLFALFLLGIMAGLFISFLLNKFLPQKTPTGFFLELPRYRLPRFKNLYYYVSFRTKAFLKTAGTIIFLLSLVLWALAYFPRSEKLTKKYQSQISTIESSQITNKEKASQIHTLENELAGEQLRYSFMGRFGKVIEPAIAPIGFDWKLGIGILTSFAAREVFVSTLGIVFNLGEADEESQSLMHILQNTKNKTGQPAYTIATALSLLVFFALAAQCMSTLAVIRRESNSWKWPVIVFGYMTILAYLGSFLTYHVTQIFI